MEKTASSTPQACDKETLLAVAKKARLAASHLASCTGEQRNRALTFICDELQSAAKEILAANQKDMANAQTLLEQGKLSSASVARLKLDATKLEGVIDAIQNVCRLPEPLGQTSLARELDQGLELYRITCPLGVVLVIFESRPDALPQISSLCLKSGNAVILKGGMEALETNRALFSAIQSGIVRAELPTGIQALLETREAVEVLLKADKFIDLVIPRGSNELVRHIQNSTRIPVLGHAEGICHIYVDRTVDLATAVPIIVDAKTQYPSACNSVETLLIHKECANEILAKLVPQLLAKGVELRGDRQTIQAAPIVMRQSIKPASDEDWTTEYCELILSIKIVDSIEDAIAHINEFGSNHTEAILSKDKKAFEQFFAKVNSAGVFWNASTRFADGYRYGFGAEVGISTGKLHPRGPVGLEGLITYKYKVIGAGQIVADYTGDKAKKFSHRDLD
jgi:glutamate-5-semialdehyde dehydrogenase